MLQLTAAAATDSAAVLDFSYTSGSTYQKYGVSAVIDYGGKTTELYSHHGATSSSSYGCSYGAGVVFNYNGPGDYSGDFIDTSTSVKYKGIDYGMDICFDPAIPSGSNGTAAIIGTVGYSLPPLRKNYSVTLGYDHYIPFALFEW